MSVSRRKFLMGAGCGIAGAAVGFTAGVFTAARPGYISASQIPRAQAVSTQADLPAEADVVVIGGGIAGISTALFLNEKKLNVVVLEKGVVAGEQSSRAFGWVYSNHWDLGKYELANQSKRIWSGFASRFDTDVGFRASGNYVMMHTDEEISAAEEWLKHARARDPQCDARIVSGAAMNAVIAGAGDKYKAMLYQASDGTAEPVWSVSRIAEGAMREGVKIVAPCAARTIEYAAGRVAGVHTEQGFIKCQNVVLAGGAWSALFAENAGYHLPQLSIDSSMMRISSAEGTLPGAGYGPDFVWRQMANGETSIGVMQHIAPVTKASFKYLTDFFPSLRYSSDLLKITFTRDFFHSLNMKSRWSAQDITPFEEIRMLSGQVDHAATQEALANLRRAWPAYQQTTVKEQWAGIIDASPDSTPYISAVANRNDIYVITGFSGNGLTTGPAAGQMLAQLIAGDQTTCNPHIYRFNRFSDGSPFTFRH
ncbi:FAD-binding oxidoreductase [Erwinia sp. INIA-01]|uniref:NAD(P)/FAD-dependent oxidoreductase n=1 Tax=Erwinia sp. INIA01 TaxID=2991500 RepID=UPI0022255245|nr:FAD-binding oxidoreductase [Erwinia sp. INIA01]MCW1873326.1 FAD-binding oxidoreductase [Erwinia sp. INIA01]